METPDYNHLDWSFSFEFLDPQTGEPPDTFNGYFSNILWRARHQLSGRSREEIFCALDLVSWLTTQEFVRRAELDAIPLEPELPKPEPAGFNRYAGPEVRSLILCAEKLSLSDQNLLPNAHWSELFATAALGLVGEAYNHERRYATEKPTRSDDDWLYPSTLGPFTIMAMEAVCLSEQHAMHEKMRADHFQQFQAAEKEKMSLRNHNAALQRHSKTNQLLRELVAFYRQGRFKTYAAAVEAFLEQIAEDRIHHLAPSNRTRTLREALSQIVRKKRTL